MVEGRRRKNKRTSLRLKKRKRDPTTRDPVAAKRSQRSHCRGGPDALRQTWIEKIALDLSMAATRRRTKRIGRSLMDLSMAATGGEQER